MKVFGDISLAAHHTYSDFDLDRGGRFGGTQVLIGVQRSRQVHSQFGRGVEPQARVELLTLARQTLVYIC